MSDIREIAKEYIEDGWAVVPVRAGQKKASTSFNKKAYCPEDFNDGDNIALKCGEPSGGRVDVDCDCMEAVQAANALLPATGLIHGRPGKPGSHHWYFCEGMKSTQFTDIKGADGRTQMIVEIRSTGGYTVAPPSVWTDKEGNNPEQLYWDQRREPMRLPPDRMYEVVRDCVAIPSLIARHWPNSGARHAMVGHLTGLLLQAGIDATLVVQIIKTAATIAKDTDIEDRVKFARNTAAKFKDGQPVTGGPRLSEVLPQAVVTKLRGWLRMADVDAIDEMNQRHFVVRIGKDAVIGREDDDYVVFQQPKALYVEYANRKVVVEVDDKGKPKLQPLFEAWLQAENRRSYRKVVLAPPPVQAAPEDYNLWTGYAITPAPEGTCPRFLEHLHEVICSGNDDHYRYLTKLLAYTIQQPGIPSQVAMVMRGQIGTGKGTLVRMLERIFGRHFIQLDKVDQIVGRFNSALSGKVIVFADEAFWAGDKREVGALKRLITEPTLAIEHKNVDILAERNCVHLFMATNEEWAIPAGQRERRFFAVDVSTRRIKNRPYFDAIYEELENGGAAAFLHEMLQVPVTANDVRDVPMTKELAHQQILSLPLELQWWFDCLYEGSIGTLIKPWGGKVVTDAMYSTYESWARPRTRHPLNKSEFSRRMGEYFTTHRDPKTGVRTVVSNGERVWKMRTIGEAREVFCVRLDNHIDWPPVASQQQAF